jgi:hypothetical protein
MRKWIGFAVLAVSLWAIVSAPVTGQAVARLFGTASDGSAVAIGVVGNALKVSGSSGAAWQLHAAAGATETANFALGSRHRIILDENLTLTLTNPVDGQSYLIKLIQDAAATNTVTWADEANIYWSDGGTPPVITATANAISLCALVYDGTLSKYDGSCSLDHK